MRDVAVDLYKILSDFSPTTARLANGAVSPNSIRFIANDSYYAPQSLFCPNPKNEGVKGGFPDYQNAFISAVSSTRHLSAAKCDYWIEKPVFFTTAHPTHVYFRFIQHFNLFQAIKSRLLRQDQIVTLDILNLSDGDHTKQYHQIFESDVTAETIPQGIACIKELIMVPTAYNSLIFTCKTNGRIRSNCFRCSGNSEEHADVLEFRKAVVESCGLDDSYRNPRGSPVITFISRKPYRRNASDKLKKFNRVLQNESELLAAIRATFPNATVRAIRPELLSICEQVQATQESDLVMGVHGAGLVHFWWIRDDALAWELEPPQQKSNPSFRMLTTLAARNYKRSAVKGTHQLVSANLGTLIPSLAKTCLVGREPFCKT